MTNHLDLWQDVPAYLNGAEMPLTEDNFDHTDILWTGSDGTLDPDEVLATHGQDVSSPIERLITSLVADHQPELSQEERQRRVAAVLPLITGTSRPRGRPKKDDSALLLEIAWRFHKRLHQSGQWPIGKIKLNPVVVEVIRELGANTPRERGIDEESLAKILCRKFNKNRDLWLAMATCSVRPNRKGAKLASRINR